MFKNNFDFLYKSSGLTQEDFGALFGATNRQVSNWRSGRTEPNIDTLIKISSACNVSIDWLVGVPGIPEDKFSYKEITQTLDILRKNALEFEKVEKDKYNDLVARFAKYDEQLNDLRELLNKRELLAIEKEAIDKEVNRRESLQKKEYIKNYKDKNISLNKLPPAHSNTMTK